MFTVPRRGSERGASEATLGQQLGLRHFLCCLLVHPDLPIQARHPSRGGLLTRCFRCIDFFPMFFLHRLQTSRRQNHWMGRQNPRVRSISSDTVICARNGVLFANTGSRGFAPCGVWGRAPRRKETLTQTSHSSNPRPTKQAGSPRPQREERRDRAILADGFCDAVE